MPASLRDPPAVGAKLVTVYANNHARGLPSHLATIVLLDHETGALRGGAGRPLHHRSAHRRGVGGVREAPGAAGARVLAIIGMRRAGAQPSRGDRARAHADARCACGARTRAIARRSRRHGRRHRRRCARVDTAAQAVRGADIVVLATVVARRRSSRTRWIARRRAHLRRRRLPARSAGDATGARRARRACSWIRARPRSRRPANR